MTSPRNVCRNNCIAATACYCEGQLKLQPSQVASVLKTDGPSESMPGMACKKV